MKKVFIITGEHSGDMHAGKVVEILKSENPDLEIPVVVTATQYVS